MTYHDWGDDWPYFGDVSLAASEIGHFCRKWGRINVTQTKEKFGTCRVYLSFGWNQIHSITHPGYYRSQYPKWLWTLDCLYFSKIIRLSNKFIIPIQIKIYQLAYKRALQKYPHIREEILVAADYPECLLDIMNS